MELELVELFNREVDLLDRRTVEQSARPRSRAEILNTAHVVYSAPVDPVDICAVWADDSHFRK